MRNTIYALIAFALFVITGCSTPHIIVLDDPLTAEEHINLGVSYEKNGEYDSALEQYALAIKKAKKSLKGAEKDRIIGYAHLNTANVYFLKGRYADSEKSYKKAIEIAPLLSDAYNNLAWLYCTQGRELGEAEKLALKALELSPGAETYLDTFNKIQDGQCPPLPH